jgi:cytoskeletal protein CcmA (bactofilin family)
MPPLSNTSVVLAKPGITVSYLDMGTGATSTQNISFLNKTFSLDSGLAVTAGGATFASTVAITGATSVSSSLTVANSTVLGAVLDVTGASRFRNQVDVSGALYASSLLDVTAIARLRSTLQVDSAVTLQSTLNVAGASLFTGAVSTSNTLTVAGVSQLNNALNVVGATSLSSILNVSGLVTAGAGLTVSGATTLNNALAVTGTSQLTGAVTTTAGVTVGGALAVTGNTNVAIFTATGAATLSNTLTAQGAVTIANTLAVSSAINARAALDVVGHTTLTTLTTSGAVSAGTSLATGTTLTVGTTSLLSGNVTATSDVLVKGTLTVSSLSSILGGSLNVAGAAAFGSGIILNGALNMSTSAAYIGSASTINDLAVGGNFNVAKVTALQSTLSVSKETTLSDTLTVAKLTTLNDGLIVAKAANLQSTLTVAKETILQSTLSVISSTTLGGSLTVAGAATLSDSLTVNKVASFVSSVSMNSSLYVANATSISSLLNVSGAASVGGALNVSGAVTFGNNLTVQGNLFVNGTTTALETSTLQVKDNGILIADGNVTDLIQSGVMVQYQPSGAAAPLYAGMKRQATTGEFIFFKDSANQISQTSVPQVAVNFNSGLVDSRGSATLAATGSPAFSSIAGSNGLSLQLANTAGTTPSQYVVGSCAPGANFTVAVNFQATALPAGTASNTDSVIFAMGSGSTLTCQLNYSNLSGYAGFVVNATVAGQGMGSSTPRFTPLTTGVWHQAVVVYNVATGVTVYLDGTIVSSTSGTMTSAAPTFFTIGGVAYTGSAYSFQAVPSAMASAFNGYVDDFRIFNYAIANLAALTSEDTYAVVMADSFNCASDSRLKKNIVNLDGALDKIDLIRGVYHDWIDESQGGRQIGVIAQEIQAVYPELVMEGGNGFLSVNYPKLTAVLLQSVKELKALILSQ